MDLSDFLEHIDSVSPGKMAMSIDGGKGTLNYFLDSMSPRDILDACNLFLGQTFMGPTGDGRIDRSLPPAHPLAQMWCCSAISDIQGMGQFTKVAPAFQLESPTMPFAALYNKLRFSVDFTPPKWPIIPNGLIADQQGLWFNFDGDPEPYTFVREWDRYTEFVPDPQFQAVSGQQGTWRFRTDHSGTPDPGAGTGQAFTGVPRMYLPDQKVSFIWHQVPYRLVTSPNSIINSPFIGCVNQNPFPPGGSRINLGIPQFNAGELLYIGYKPYLYTPPVPALSPFGDGIFSTEKLCDIEFKFLATTRVSPDIPATNPTGNANFVPSGFNLLPWLIDRLFHVAVSAVSGTDTAMSWRSFPVELLFTDCDSFGQQITVPG